jgi:hypothetical protein
LYSRQFARDKIAAIGDRHSVKLGWARGISTRIGGNFNTFAVAWQTLWLPTAR